MRRLSRKQEQSPKKRTSSTAVPNQSLYNRETHLGRAERVAARGGDDYEVAKSLAIDETTLVLWCQAYPELRTAIEKGRSRWSHRYRGLRRPLCPRCGGWLMLAIEFYSEAALPSKVPRCCNCGKRYYRTMTPVLPREVKRRKDGSPRPYNSP